MDRRVFLKTSALAMGAIGMDLTAFAEKVSLGDAKLKIGILSDIHINGDESCVALQRAFEYFCDSHVDGVLIAGDMADDGLDFELQLVADTWFKVFPKDRLPDGKHVERLFIYGNHDIDAYKWGNAQKRGLTPEEVKKQGIGTHREQTWKKCFKENYLPIYLKTIKGYHFVGAHWSNHKRIEGLEEFLNKHHEQLAGPRPFFYFQHAHPGGTIFGDLAWGRDNGETTKLLSRYPNAVAFSGHSHMPLNDERDLWQESFTSIGTASLSYVQPLGGRENMAMDDAWEQPSQMPSMNCGNGKHGMLMTVYDNHITIERREFVYDQQVADNWIIPIPKLISADAPLSYENRAKAVVTPQFHAADQVTIRRIDDGKDRKGQPQKQVEITFPNVLKKTHGMRAFDYEVQVEYVHSDVSRIIATKRVYSSHCYLGEAQDEAPVKCVYGESELPDPHCKFRFVVCPCECFGKKGNPIYSEWMKL